MQGRRGPRSMRSATPVAARLALILALVVATLSVAATPATASFDSWESLGANPVGESASVSWGLDRIDVFARGTDNHLWHRWYQDSWGPWEDLGGSISSPPAVASWAPGRLDVVAARHGRRARAPLVRQRLERMGDPRARRGYLTSAPTAATWGPGRLDVFARGTAGDLVHRFYEFGAWSGWDSLGGGLVGAPAAAGSAPTRLDVVVRGTDDALYHRGFAPPGWGTWSRVGGTLNGPPAVTAHAGGILDVVVTGSDNALYHQTRFGNWLGWQRIGGVATSGPSVTSWAAGPPRRVRARHRRRALAHLGAPAPGQRSRAARELRHGPADRLLQLLPARVARL